MSVARAQLGKPLWAALVVALLWTGGCARWNWRGHGYDEDNDAKIAQRLRPPADPKQFSGLDARAQDIERDLGVR